MSQAPASRPSLSCHSSTWSNDPEQEFFSDGIAEDILNKLAKSATLTVRPRSSSFALKGAAIDLQSIGERLNVTHVLEGSVRRSGARVRVTAQLSEVAANRTVWSDRFERPMSDIFAVQDDISAAILSALNIRFALGQPRAFAGVDAYEAFLKGRDYVNRGIQPNKAIVWLNEAIRLDPANMEAWRLLVTVTWNLIYNTPQAKQLRPQLQIYLDEMEALDPNHPGLLAAKASVAIAEERSYQSSIDTLVRLATENPNDVGILQNLSEGFIAIRRFDLAAQTMRHVASLDPLSPYSRGSYIAALLAAGELDLAKSELEPLEQLGAIARFSSMEVALSTGDLVTLETDIESGRAAIGNNSFYVRREALLRRLQGDNRRAAELLADLRNASSPVSKDYGGLSYSDQQEAALILGRLDDALHFFDKAMAAGEQQAISGTYGGYHAFRKIFPEYYSDPRYIEILEKYHADDASLAEVAVPGLPF